MLHESVLRVVLSYKRRLSRGLKKRSPLDRLKRRSYYAKNKRKIALRRKRYLSKNKPFLKTRKLYKRQKPGWLIHKKTVKRPKIKVIKPKKHKSLMSRPKPHRMKPFKPHKIHVPKRIH